MSDNNLQTPIDNQSGSGRSKSSRLKTIFLVLLILVAVGLSLYPIVALYLASESLDSEIKKEVSPADISYDVAMVLVNWEVFGDYPTGPAGFQKLHNSVSSRITGLRGFSERGGFPFSEDGADWYELELSSDLVAELRTNLEQVKSVTKGNFPPEVCSPPSWWPKSWPSASKCYQNYNCYLLLPASGTRAWFMREAH